MSQPRWLSLTPDTGGEFLKQVDSEPAGLMTMADSGFSDAQEISPSRSRCAQTLAPSIKSEGESFAETRHRLGVMIFRQGDPTGRCLDPNFVRYLAQGVAIVGPPEICVVG
jgi:hypothetical protein